MKKLLFLLALSLTSCSQAQAGPLDPVRRQLAYTYLTQVLGIDPVTVANIVTHSETSENLQQLVFELTGIEVDIEDL